MYSFSVLRKVIAEYENGSRIGYITDLLMDSDSFRIVAVACHSGALLSGRKVYFLSQMKLCGSSAIMSGARCKHPTGALKSASALLRRRVFSDCGQFLGNCGDLLFEKETGTVRQIELLRGFFEDLTEGRKIAVNFDGFSISDDGIRLIGNVDLQKSAEGKFSEILRRSW